jgi:hypothetical protein
VAVNRIGKRGAYGPRDRLDTKLAAAREAKSGRLTELAHRKGEHDHRIAELSLAIGSMRFSRNPEND